MVRSTVRPAVASAVGSAVSPAANPAVSPAVEHGAVPPYDTPAPATEGRTLDDAAVWGALQAVKDPELPAVSLVELGVARAVVVDGSSVRVDLTPTFAGCPAFEVMRAEVEQRVRALGATAVEVRRVLAPAWSSDDVTPEGRRKLHAFGLALPRRHGGLLEIALEAPARCPRCASFDTELRNAFGSTLCREIHTCRACHETFERFKPL